MRNRIMIAGFARTFVCAAGSMLFWEDATNRQTPRKTNEADYQKLTADNSTAIPTYYPEILDRVAADRHAD